MLAQIEAELAAINGQQHAITPDRSLGQ